MFPKKNRANKKEIEKIFKEGIFVNTVNLTLKFLVKSNSKSTFLKKISFIVPKTVSKKAVVRNLLRRRGYALLKRYIEKIPDDFRGVFIFGKKSVEVFGGKKNKKYNPILNLENEIKIILYKIN